MLNMQSETYTGYDLNPYYGSVTLFRVPLKEYIETENNEKHYPQTNKSYELCLTDLVPGVITHFSLSHETKNQMVINYRRVDEEMGSLHRFRIYHNLAACENFTHSPDQLLEQLVADDKLNKYDKKSDIFEDFAVKGSFTITSLNLNAQGDQLMYSRNPDFYQYRVLLKNESGGPWTEDLTQRGPPIDRNKDKIFLPLGITYTHAN
jgi:hypothetical protein